MFAIALVASYKFFRKRYYRSPYNVYRATLLSILVKSLVTVPFELYHRGWPDAIILAGWVTLLEVGLSCFFMSILIKYLRQIHILNGVKKREKGVKSNVN